MKDHWENDEKMMRENTREPVVSFLILPGVRRTVVTILLAGSDNLLLLKRRQFFSRVVYVTRRLKINRVDIVFVSIHHEDYTPA